MANYQYRRRGGKLGKNYELDYSRRFLIYSAFRFLRNFIGHYRGHVIDDDFFMPATERASQERFKKIFFASATPSLRRILVKCKPGEKIDLSCENPAELMRKLWEHPASNGKFRMALREFLDVEILMLGASLKNDPAPDAERFMTFANSFKLSEIERDLLLLRRLAAGFWCCEEWSGRLSYEKFNQIACGLGISEAELQALTGDDARLRRLECLDKDLDFNRDFLPYLCGVDDSPLENKYYAKHSGESLPWEFFGELTGKHGNILTALLKDQSRSAGLHILFYGTPGTGKTSFATALAAQVGRTAYFIKQGCSSRFSAIRLCELQQERGDSLIVIDEADKLLDCAEMNFLGQRSSNGDKGALNVLLDQMKTPCLWITNTPAEALDESNRRRFDYSIEFKAFNSKQREHIWHNIAQKYDIELGVAAEKKLAARYRVSAGGIEIALRNFAAVGEGEVEDKIEKILAPHCSLMQISAGEASVPSGDYLLDGLNIKGDLMLTEIIDAARNYLTLGLDSSPKPRMNLLLSGPPGTGKTEFVKYLGKTLSAPVVTKMGSDILSKWVGGTEQNIAGAFREAESQGAILFFDEIDGLVQNRERAQHTWEVTQVNEFLHRMENFSGIMIGATNFIRNLDPALARRFTFKLEFDYLDAIGKRLFFERMFQSPLTPEEVMRLAEIPNLTPGDFYIARQSLFYLGKQVDNARRLAALQNEVKSKNNIPKRLGF